MGETHHHLHVVLHDQDREVAGDAADQLHGGVGLGHAHARGRLVQAQEAGFRGERDADLEVPLLAVREVHRQLGLLAGEADVGEDGAGAVHDVGVGSVVAEHAPVVVA